MLNCDLLGFFLFDRMILSFRLTRISRRLSVVCIKSGGGHNNTGISLPLSTSACFFFKVP